MEQEYTLTLNLAGDYEAFGQDGYTIYVDGGEFDRTASSGTYSIPAGATVSTYNNSMHTHGYEYSETITPTPSYNEDGSWIMDRDYEITVTATPDEEIIYYTINTSWEENSGVDYTDIVFKDPATGEWDYNTGSKVTSLTLPKDTEYYVIVGCYPDHTHAGYGREDSPLILDEDITFNVVPEKDYSKVIITISNPFADYSEEYLNPYMEISIARMQNNGYDVSDIITFTKDSGSHISYEVDSYSQFTFAVTAADISHQYWDYHTQPPTQLNTNNNYCTLTADTDYTIYFSFHSG